MNAAGATEAWNKIGRWYQKYRCDRFMSALKKEEAGIKLPKMQLFNVRGRRFFKTDKNVQTCVVYNAVVE